MMIHSVYVGKYDKMKDGRDVFNKLTSEGFRCLWFTIDKKYSINVYQNLDLNKCNTVKQALESKGYEAFIVE